MLKVMIADDEERICQLIEALVDWEALHMEVAGIAHNGLEACDMVKQLHPDILITDIRMPGCNGLELIERVKRSTADLEIIIISGYAHFDYAKTAIKFGVGDYLLKPVNKTELLSTLCKLKDRIETRQESEENRMKLQQKSKNDVRRLKRNLLEWLTEQKEGVLSAEILQNEYYVNVKPGVLQAFLLKMDGRNGAVNRAESAVVMERAENLLESSFKNRCMEMLIGQRTNVCVGFLNYDKGSQEEIRRVMRDCLNQLESGRAIYGTVTFSAALGRPVERVEELKESFYEVAVIIEERLIKGTGRLLERMPSPSAIAEKNLLEKYLRQVIHAIELMSVEEAAAAVQDMEQSVKEIRDARGYEVQELVHSAANLFLSQVEVARRKDELKQFEDGCALCGSMEQLFGQLTLLQNRYLEEMNRKHESDTVRPVRLAKQYIQNHFMEPVTQEEVSSAVGLSAAYFSVLFKKVEGEGFARYLINVRIDQAKVLLRETNIPVSKVCRQVGYNDLKHFTHTFEKATGVKPSVYRKLYG